MSTDGFRASDQLYELQLGKEKAAKLSEVLKKASIYPPSAGIRRTLHKVNMITYLLYLKSPVI